LHEVRRVEIPSSGDKAVNLVNFSA
jgi:hypothetical protein